MSRTPHSRGQREEGRGRAVPGLSINTRVVLIWGELHSPSLVQDMKPEGVWLGMPLVSGVTVIPRPGQKLEVAYPGPRGRYAFKTRVRRVSLAEPALIMVEWPQRVEKTQEREFFRLPISRPLRWRREGAGDWTRSVTRDLSAGGALVRGEIPAGGSLEVEIDLPDRTVPLEADVVREDGGDTAIRFTAIGTDEQDAITAYLFETQRDMRRRGLI